MNRHFLPLCAAMLCVCIASGQSKNFKAVSLNVDGLPESLLGGAIKMNVGGPLEAGSKAMGEFISTQRTDWDLFALSEDFNFEDELKAGLGDVNIPSAPTEEKCIIKSTSSHLPSIPTAST